MLEDARGGNRYTYMYTYTYKYTYIYTYIDACACVQIYPRKNSLSLCTGGLGKKMVVGVYQIYLCVEGHECSTTLDPWFCW